MLYIFMHINAYQLKHSNVVSVYQWGAVCVTLRAIAETLGVKPVTVYRRLKAKGIGVETLRDAEGNITTEGAAIIASMFDGSPDDTAIQERIKGAYQSVSDETLQSETALQTEAAVLRERCRGLEATVDRLDAECARLRAEVSTLTGMLQAEQAQRALLLGDGNQRRGHGLFAWFRGRGKGDN